MKDSYGREIDYLRISVTDRCNLRCRYCMPEEGISTISMAEILTFEEIVRVCQCAVGLGIRKIRLTGGEPLVRRNSPALVAMIKNIPGIESVSITTNGLLLTEYLPELLDAGLDAVNISLDTMDPELYRQITRFDKLDCVLEAIDACCAAGLNVKVNAVLLPEPFYNGEPEKGWLSLLPLARDKRVHLRFIELMPIGEGQQYYQMPMREVLETLQTRYPDMQPDPTPHGYGPAKYYTIPGFCGSVGLIEAIHGKFCHECNRIRLESTGKIKPCLCYADTIDVREALRGGKSDEEITGLIAQAILAKPSSHCFDNVSDISEFKKMVSIGG